MNANIINKLNELNIPTTSIIRAIQYLNDEDSKIDVYDIYNQLKSSLPELQVLDSLDSITKKYSFLYFVQNSIKLTNNGYLIDLSEVIQSSIDSANEYLSEHRDLIEARLVSTGNSDNIDKPKVEKIKVPKEPKITKRSKAVKLYNDNPGIEDMDFVKQLMELLNINEMCARVYLYNLKKGIIS